ncbi:MAG: response regulator [Deltaproteobacteria bacterium]|nr:response regulator [Deltaproteobacteria bacterium]
MSKKEKINILIVDDEEDFLKSISKSLEVRDFNVIAVNRGEKAITAARENLIDIALVDLKMPGMNGEETLLALKKENQWMEVVILTGHGTIESALSCKEGGAYSFLQKPCELDILLETLVKAYKTRLMNRKKVDAEKIKEILNIEASPWEILRRLKEIDSE